MRRGPIVLLLALFTLIAACGDDDTVSTDAAGSVPAATAPTGDESNAGDAKDPDDEPTTDSSPGTADAGEPATMWVTDFPAAQLAQVDLDSATCQLSDMGNSADLVAFGLGGVWVTDGFASQLVFVDPASGEVLGRRDVGGWPSDIALSDTSIWLTMPDTNSVLEIDPATGDVLAEMPFGEPPSAIALGSYAVGTWDGPLYFDDADEGVDWMRDMGGSIYDAQFYNGYLWVLVVFFDEDHNPTGSEIWVFDPLVNDAVLFDSVPDYLNGILVDDHGVWANSLRQSEDAWWKVPMPGFAPATDDPYWVAAAPETSPAKWRFGGSDIFQAHHHEGRVTRRDDVDPSWGLQRSQGDAPSLWDQPGIIYYDMFTLCGDDTLGLSDVAVATASELADALGATPDPWDSDPMPEGGPGGGPSAFFSSCSLNSSSDGTVGAGGTLDGADEGAIVMFNVIGADGTSYLMGNMAVDADGNFEFPSEQSPVSPPFTIEVVAGGSRCERLVE